MSLFLFGEYFSIKGTFSICSHSLLDFSFSSLASPISTAFNLPVGVNDPHWLYEFNGFTGSTIVGGAGDAWKQFSPSANWVSPPLAEGSGAETGNYTFTTHFNLSSSDLNDYTLKAHISSDNNIVGIIINDLNVPLVSPCNIDKTYTCTTDYEFKEGLIIDGDNTMTFIVNNLEYIPASDSRVGLYVEFVI